MLRAWTISKRWCHRTDPRGPSGVRGGGGLVMVHLVGQFADEMVAQALEAWSDLFTFGAGIGGSLEHGIAQHLELPDGQRLSHDRLLGDEVE